MFSILRKIFLKKTPRRPKNAKMVFTQTGKIGKISLTMKRQASPLRSRAPIRPFFVDAYSPTPVKIGIIRVSSKRTHFGPPRPPIATVAARPDYRRIKENSK